MPAAIPAVPLSWRARIGALCALLIASIVGIIAWMQHDARQAVRREAIQASGNLALALEGDIGRVMATLDLSLADAVAGMRLPGLDAVAPAMRQAILFNGTVASGSFGGLGIIDRAGNVLHGTAGLDQRWPPAAWRAVFADIAGQPGGGLLIGRALQGEGAERSLVLARRIPGTDDRLAVALLRVGYFGALFGALDIGRDGVVDIRTADGMPVARHPPAPADAAPANPWAAMGAGQASATVEMISPVDGVRRIYSQRRIGTLPLLLSVGTATSEIYADWTRKTLILGGVVALLLALAAILALSLRHLLRRHADAEAAATAAAREHALALARLDTIFANSADSMLMVRVLPGGRLAYEAVNPVWQRLTGVAAAAAIGRTPEECLPPRLAADTLADWREALRLGHTHRVTFRSEPPGIARDWEAAIVPVRDETGTVQRLVSIGRDITERNALEAQLRQTHRAEAVGQLATGIAHEFNNLLQAITGALEVLADQPGLDADGRACAATAGDAARRAATLVHRLLAFSRRQALNPVVLDPQQVLGAIVPLIGRTLGEDIAVVAEAEPGVWPVLTDRDQLENCLLNLALNARDAMPEGGVLRFLAGNGPAGPGGADQVVFTVADSGCGMAPETLARALEPFFTTKPIGAGSGLGLSMVQGFARQSGGDVAIESCAGGGTTVRLWLPRATAPAAPAPPARPVPAGAVPRARVMVVDDEALIRRTLVSVLDRAGLATLALASGADALQRLRDGAECDLLITDQSMPGMTGSDLIRHVATLRPDLPAILITGFDKVSGVETLPDHVVVLYKPFERAVLLHQVRTALAAPADRLGAVQGNV